MSTLFPLAVVGKGALSPAGAGLASLLATAPLPESDLPSLRAGSSHVHRVLRVDPRQPALQRWNREPRLRRASPVGVHLVEAVAQALEGWPRPVEVRLGLVAAFFCGCPAYSRRFFEPTIRQGPSFASPALFPETVYNSPLSHAAAVHGISGPAYAVVGDDSAWIEALRVGATWIARDEVDAVVVAAAEELDAISVEAYAAARWLRPGGLFRPSEGAGALLLRRPQEEDRQFITDLSGGFGYRDPAGAARAAASLLSGFHPQDPLFSTAGRGWLADLETRVGGNRLRNHDAAYLGEAFPTSAAWQTIRALSFAPEGGCVVPVWGQNHQFAALKIERQ